MKQIDYNLPIFLFTVGISGLSVEKAENKIAKIKESFEPLNMNVIFVEDRETSSDKMTCLWQGSQMNMPTMQYEMEF